MFLNKLLAAIEQKNSWGKNELKDKILYILAEIELERHVSNSEFTIEDLNDRIQELRKGK